MAFWVLGGNNGDGPLDNTIGEGATSKFHANSSFDLGYNYGHDAPPRWPSAHWTEYNGDDAQYPNTGGGQLDDESVPIRNLAFLVIRENSHHAHGAESTSPSPKPPFPNEIANTTQGPQARARLTLERTESGISITSDHSASHHHGTTVDTESGVDGSFLLDDLEAARQVRKHIASYRRHFPDSQPERILKALISPKSRGADFPLDNDALRSIFSAANELFFVSRLTRRVTWDWSHSEAAQYDNHIVGTTAVRRSARLGGWETLIVLSSPILRDTKYNRRLLISTFLHEMIHSFMFVTCGLKAKKGGGHTEGFREIAGIIDDWAGCECLRMRDMEADLDRWRGDNFHDEVDDGGREHYGHHQHRADASSHDGAGNRLHGSMPPWQSAPDEWQWYEREDFGSHFPVVSSHHLHSNS